MVEYRVKGLSCGNCAQVMENELRQLEFGATTTLSFRSGKLILDPRVSLPLVETILKSDGAFIVKTAPAHDPAHGHEHDPARDRHEINPDSRYPHAHSGHDHDHDHKHNHSHGNGNLLIKGLIASAVVYLAAILLSGAWNDYIGISLYLVAIALSGTTTFIRGARNLLRLKFNIDTLMTIALVGAIAIGEWKEATLVALLFGLNELLEGYGMEKARRSMESLLQVAPKEALTIREGQERVVPIASLRIGDLVIVKPGGKIPSDGTVQEGRSSVNEAAITGESLPVDKAAGDPVFGGSINNEGVLRIRMDKAYKDSSLARILHLVEEAQETKTPTELFINKFANYYTPLIMIIAALVILVPPLLLGGDWSAWLYQGLAVLIVGCPCALILSSPIAIVAGITRNARHGVLVKGGVFLEQLGKLDMLAFDKTGTLTKGEPHVEQALIYDHSRFHLVSGAIEKSSSHPLAKAVMREVERHLTTLPEAEDVQAVPGRGITATVEGHPYWLGNEQNMAYLTIPASVQADIDQLKSNGLTLVIVADRERILGMYGIADEIRPESKDVIAALHRVGIRNTVMLTGDHPKTAEKVASLVGVTSFHGSLLPEDKVNKIKELSLSGNVGMIGDGINDAPALATATLGIAMGKGTDSAIETADIVLMQDHLGKLPEAVRIAKRMNRIIKFNITVSLGLKLIALLLTIPGWLTLWIAILSDMGATIFVTLVSLTLLIERKPQ